MNFVFFFYQVLLQSTLNLWKTCHLCKNYTRKPRVGVYITFHFRSNKQTRYKEDLIIKIRRNDADNSAVISAVILVKVLSFK